MKRKKSLLIKSLVFLVNLAILIGLILLLLYEKIIFEAFLALIFLQSLIDGFLLFRYFIYKRAQRMAAKLGFHFLTVYMEQPRMEGIYKKNWWQIHLASRPYGEYWGKPRTYIKLQYKKNKKFDEDVLMKYHEYSYKGMRINRIEHITRPYKDYLLMKVMWYIFDTKRVHLLMDLLIKIAKEAERK